MKNIATILLLLIPIVIASTNNAKYVDVNDQEITLMAKVVETEAKGENFHGKYLVASTIINRLKDNRFPSSVNKILFEPNQYARPSIKYSEQSLLAVKHAIRDPYPNILYFYNPKKAKNKRFISRLSKCIMVGNHKFCSNFK